MTLRRSVAAVLVASFLATSLALSAGIVIQAAVTTANDDAAGWFADQLQRVRDADAQVGPAGAAVDARPDSEQAQRTYIQSITECLRLAQRYDQQAAKVPAGRWTNSALPRRIDTTDPATDCREPHPVQQEGNAP